MDAIAKDELKGKHIAYIDAHGKQRCGKATRMSGNYVTVKDAVGKKRRVYKDSVLGRQFKNKIVGINWERKRSVKK